MSDFHGRMMNLQIPEKAKDAGDDVTLEYKKGFRDARHAGAEMCIEADMAISESLTILDDVVNTLRSHQAATTNGQIEVMALLKRIEAAQKNINEANH